MPSNSTEFNDMWERCRSHVVHENELLNHRVTWLLSFHAFAITVLAGILSADSVGSPLWLLPIPIFGCITTWLTHPLILAAVNAHDQWGKNWKDYFKKCSKKPKLAKTEAQQKWFDVVGSYDTIKDGDHGNDDYPYRKDYSNWWKFFGYQCCRVHEKKHHHHVLYIVDCAGLLWIVTFIIILLVWLLQLAWWFFQQACSCVYFVPYDTWISCLNLPCTGSLALAFLCGGIVGMLEL